MTQLSSATYNELKAAGLKVTIARRAVLDALIESPGHLTAEDLLEIVTKTYPEIHISTIYRTLDTLESTRVVDHVHLGHGRAVYHLASNSHQHLVCEHCGLVLQVPDETIDAFASAIDRDYGFALRRNHFAVIGTCRTCRATGNDSDNRSSS
ncbi:MAG: Fur family transcriptional regulator [Acidimicrobiales bacterium]